MSRARVRVLTLLVAVALAAGTAWLGWFLWSGRQPPARARLVHWPSPAAAAVAVASQQASEEGAR